MVAFIDVHVVPMTGERVIEHQTVLIVGERIHSITPAVQASIPEDARRIDASGRYLMPGLAEMHAHIPTARRGHRWTQDVLFLYLANGITTIRGMLGEPAHLRVRDRVAGRRVLGPRIYTSGPGLNGESIPSPDSARLAVLYQKRMGYDFLKLQPGLTREAFEVIVRTADSVGIPFAGHVPVDVGLDRALESGYATIDHLDGYVPALIREGSPLGPEDQVFFGANLIDDVDESKIPELARKTRETGTWNVPTMTLFHGFLLGDLEQKMATQADVRYMDPRFTRSWIRASNNVRRITGANTAARVERYLRIRTEVLRALHRAGAGLLLGTDAPQVFNVPGFSIHEELAIYVDAGLTPYEALATGTRNVARFFGADGEYGTVEEGKIADLVLLEANPLQDVANLRRLAGVMVRGQWLSASDIRERLQGMAAAFSRSAE